MSDVNSFIIQKVILKKELLILKTKTINQKRNKKRYKVNYKNNIF